MAVIKRKKELTRRHFLKSTSNFVLGTPVILSSISGNSFTEEVDLTCLDIHNHFKSTETGKKVNWEKTTDTFKCGDPSRPVRKVAVAWKASWDALLEAANKGADLFISHESICVHARNGSPETEVFFALPSEKPKFDLLEKTGLVVYRCHDVWDQFPKIGIRDTWQKRLNIGDRILVDKYPIFVTEVTPITVGELARHILKQIKPLRQNGVMVSGSLEK